MISIKMNAVFPFFSGAEMTVWKGTNFTRQNRFDTMA